VLPAAVGAHVHPPAVRALAAPQLLRAGAALLRAVAAGVAVHRLLGAGAVLGGGLRAGDHSERRARPGGLVRARRWVRVRSADGALAREGAGPRAGAGALVALR